VGDSSRISLQGKRLSSGRKRVASRCVGCIRSESDDDPFAFGRGAIVCSDESSSLRRSWRHAQLEDFCFKLADDSPSTRLRRALIERVASMVGRMHQHGMNIETAISATSTSRAGGGNPLARKDHLYVIDLHRASCDGASRRWQIKDSPALFLLDGHRPDSADCCRFIRAYEQGRAGRPRQRGRFLATCGKHSHHPVPQTIWCRNRARS